MDGDGPVWSDRGEEGRESRDAAAPSPEDTSRREAPRSGPLVPSLNLAVVANQRQAERARSKSLVREESRAQSDSKLTNAGTRREVESFKVKINERRDDVAKHGEDRRDGKDVKNVKDGRNGREWAYLTSANLKECAKAYASSSSRQDSMRRVKQWIQQSKPPYDSNPSPGIPALMTSPHSRQKQCSIGSMLWQRCPCLGRPRTL